MFLWCRLMSGLEDRWQFEISRFVSQHSSAPWVSILHFTVHRSCTRALIRDTRADRSQNVFYVMLCRPIYYCHDAYLVCELKLQNRRTAPAPRYCPVRFAQLENIQRTYFSCLPLPRDSEILFTPFNEQVFSASTVAIAPIRGGRVADASKCRLLIEKNMKPHSDSQ